MKTEAHRHRHLPALDPGAVDLGEAPLGLHTGAQRPGRCGTVPRFPKHREDGIPDELQHVPTLRIHRSDDRVEGVVEQASQGRGRQLTAERGVAHHVAEADRGVDLHHVSPPNVPIEDPVRRILADVGGEQPRTAAPMALEPEEDREDRDDIQQGLHVLL